MATSIYNNNISSSMNDDDVFIYHMCQKERWQAAIASGEQTLYYPPTFEIDGGFVHATQHPGQLLQVANHFYQNPKDDEWICLQLRPSVLLKDFGIRTVWEAPAPVGSTASFNSSTSAESPPTDSTPVALFPHVYGGIPTSSSAGVVVNIYPMHRDTDGKFLSIPGFVE